MLFGDMVNPTMTIYPEAMALLGIKLTCSERVHTPSSDQIIERVQWRRHSYVMIPDLLRILTSP